MEMLTPQQWETVPDYLFVAWITPHFPDNGDDQAQLHELARHATKEAGLSCYWISHNCLADLTDQRNLSLDVC
jgi:hypothetical protein